MSNQYIISIIITTYEAQHSIKRCITSALNSLFHREIELVVVDDCSKDNTYKIVEDLQKKHENISLYKTDKNSGGPSEPRNLGIQKAKGEYITFLDDDDEIKIDNLFSMLKKIQLENADFAKGYLICVKGNEKNIMNRLSFIPKNTEQTIKHLIISQSMTQDFIVRRNIIKDNNLRYDESLKIGEDTVFISSILTKVKKAIYIDNYFLLYNKTPVDISNLSATQRWGNKEVLSQLKSWSLTQEVLSTIGIDYYKLRLPAGFRNLLLSIVRFSSGISLDTYNKLSEFTNETKFIEKSMNLSIRYLELYKSIIANDYGEYCIKSKKRLLISGYDLKFVIPLIKYLEKDYEVKIDEWLGHNNHNEENSNKMVQWADVIWCEWMLGNAVYYSNNKHKNQIVIIRAHRFELDRNFGHKINWDNVDMVFTVGYYYYEQFISRFDIPRYKVRLLSNYVEESIYSEEKEGNYKFNIGIIGILPKRKGFLRGIKILEKLLAIDKNFKLYIIGKNYNEVDWIKNNPSENKYYTECEKYIEDKKLENNIIYGGFVERDKIYNNLGYVLSLSDNEKPESFHLAPAEAACSGSIGMILNWPGSEYIYPKDAIYINTDDIVRDIIKCNKDEKYYCEKSDKFKNFIHENYSINRFLNELNRYLLEAFIIT